MKALMEKIRESLSEDLIMITISSPRKKEEIRKYTVRPVLIRDSLKFQITAHSLTQVFHENLAPREAAERIEELLPDFRQVNGRSAEGEWSALISKKGKATLRETKKIRGVPEDKTGKNDLTRLSHNRRKRYILEEGTPVPFLIDLGVMTKEGAVVRKRYDKFRQINRFLEFIEDILPALPRGRTITILDFGCGKSYLTFAMYYYLKELKGYPIRIIGLDRKKDVIRHCAMLAGQYGYDELTFLEGNVEDYAGEEGIDMMVTLHACDTATDYALYKAMCAKASVILSVPCCQHELNAQFSAKNAGDAFSAVSDYGLLTERFCAMATDGLRAELLEYAGYDTQILEFIDMEHTPKNLLIRAVRRREEPDRGRLKKAEAFCETYGFSPSLLRLMKEGGMTE